MLFHDSGNVNFPDEEWVFEVCPELNDLENDTLDSLLAQAQTHAAYERAARDLLVQERLKQEEAHERELYSLRVQLESEAMRKASGYEARVKGVEEGAQEELDELRQEAQEKIRELEGVIEELEEKVETQTKRIEEVEAEAEEECERLRAESMAVVSRLQEAEEETDLKRETQRKLKEEIIDNDRLTLANLNRIKTLESQLDQQKDALLDAERENDTLREDLEKSIHQTEEAEHENKTLREELGKSIHQTDEAAEEEVTALRELLEEREAQLMAMSHRLSDALSSNAENTRRRDSFIDRLPFKSFASSSA
jgi:chromosome segregation ATPase